MKLKVLFCMLSLLCSINAHANEAAGEESEQEVVQKITFIEDDAQYSMVSKVFKLKTVKAADLAPFVKTAAVRFDPASSVTRLSTPENGEMLLVTTAEDMMPYITEMVSKMDFPHKETNGQNAITGTGITYGNYTPRYRSAAALKRVIVDGQIASGADDSRVMFNKAGNYFYYKDTRSRVEEIEKFLSLLDYPLEQCRLTFHIYSVRDNDLKDIGIDYLAWKNGPGLNLFSAGFEAFSIDALEYVFEELTQQAISLSGNLSYGYGSMFVAPAFDMSFIRLLNECGKSTLNAQAQLIVTNDPTQTFSISFSPEYQKITKDENFQAAVEIGGEACIQCAVEEVILCAPQNDSMHIAFKNTLSAVNVLERDNSGREISQSTHTENYSALYDGEEKILCSWSRESEVEQNIGVPFLCNIPILKYIFSTTTTQKETYHYFLSVSAERIPFTAPLRLDTNKLLNFSDTINTQKQNQTQEVK